METMYKHHRVLRPLSTTLLGGGSSRRRQKIRHTRPLLTALKLALAAVVVLAALAASPAYAQFDPVTLAAAAAEAKAIAGQAKDFLQFIGYLPGDPDPLAKLAAKLGEIQASLDHLQATANQILATVQRLEAAEVRDDNVAALEDYLDALAHVTSARIALAHLADHPTDAVLQYTADNESLLAVQAFETRPRMFTIYGELATEWRFCHLVMYGGYVQALMVRVAAIQALQGARGFTHAPFNSELLTSAATLRDLIQETNTGIEVRTTISGRRSTFQCFGASLTLVDHILYDLETVEAHTTAAGYVAFPTETCDLAAVNFYLEEPINQARAGRAAQYGVNELSDLADMLTSYADYGQPAQPAYQFGTWIMGAEYNTANTFTFVPNGNAVPGAAVQLVVPAQHAAYQLPSGTGPITHMASGLCLTGAASSTFTLEVCNGTLAGGAADDQTWTRQPNGTIVHNKTGLCLSGVITGPVLVGSGGTGITVGGGLSTTGSGGLSTTGSGGTGITVGGGLSTTVGGGLSTTGSGGTGTPPSVSLPRLNLAACNAGHPDQVWSTIDPTNPPPPIR